MTDATDDRDWKEFAEQWDEHEPTGTYDCIQCATVTPGMPPHNQSTLCDYRPTKRTHCACSRCFG